MAPFGHERVLVMGNYAAALGSATSDGSVAIAVRVSKVGAIG